MARLPATSVASHATVRVPAVAVEGTAHDCEATPDDGSWAFGDAVAGEIAAKDTRVIRAAKAALNGIDPVDVNKSYRFEQGFTYELNLMGVSDELRDAFVDKQSAGTTKADKK